MGVEFKNKTINKKYEIKSPSDRRVIMPGYDGMISDIKDGEILDGMISRGNNLVALRATEVPAENAGKKATTATA